MASTRLPIPSPDAAPLRAASRHPPPVSDVTEDFHVATRNVSIGKSQYKAHETHYDPEIQRLAAHAPLTLNSADRHQLPLASELASMPVNAAIQRRTSGRAFAQEPMEAIALGTLLYLANGVTRSSGAGSDHAWYRRNVPNSGNLGSVEVFPIVFRVEGVPPGIYHFDSVEHELACVRQGDFGSWARHNVFFQIEHSTAAVALCLTSAVGRLKAKYGPRGYRLGLFDVGHVSENLYLTATALGLAICATAGFIDEELDAALGVDGLDIATMLVLLVGPAIHR